MKLHTCFYLLAAVAALIYGCKKDEPPKVTEQDLAALKAYCYFLPGTYWIYEDNRGNTDSMYVESASSGYDTVDNLTYFISRWHSTFDTYDYKVEWNTSWTSYNPTRHKVFMSKFKPGDYVGEVTILEYPFVKGNKLYSYNDNIITSVEKYEIFAVNQSSYYQTILMNESRDITNPYLQPTNYFIGLNVGIVQEELLDSNIVWKVVRYNIVQ